VLKELPSQVKILIFNHSWSKIKVLLSVKQSYKWPEPHVNSRESYKYTLREFRDFLVMPNALTKLRDKVHEFATFINNVTTLGEWLKWWMKALPFPLSP
jgi:hypothetical protein